jgi:hypothetical protein
MLSICTSMMIRRRSRDRSIPPRTTTGIMIPISQGVTGLVLVALVPTVAYIVLFKVAEHQMLLEGSRYLHERLDTNTRYGEVVKRIAHLGPKLDHSYQSLVYTLK